VAERERGKAEGVGFLVVVGVILDRLSVVLVIWFLLIKKDSGGCICSDMVTCSRRSAGS